MRLTYTSVVEGHRAVSVRNMAWNAFTERIIEKNSLKLDCKLDDF